MFHRCNVHDCASSAKSAVIVFDDRSDVFVKTMKVTVPSLPKENDVPVKSEFIFSKNNCVGFHRCVFRRQNSSLS